MIETQKIVDSICNCRGGSMDEKQFRATVEFSIQEVEDKARAEKGITVNDLVKLESLRKLCIDDDLLDLNSYDSIGRSKEISNAWEALRVIEELVKKRNKL